MCFRQPKHCTFTGWTEYFRYDRTRLSSRSSLVIETRVVKPGSYSNPGCDVAQKPSSVVITTPRMWLTQLTLSAWRVYVCLSVVPRFFVSNTSHTHTQTKWNSEYLCQLIVYNRIYFHVLCKKLRMQFKTRTFIWFFVCMWHVVTRSKGSVWAGWWGECLDVREKKWQDTGVKSIMRASLFVFSIKY